jgi:hypothetical protein
MKDFRLAALSVSISYGIFECEILTLGKLVFFIASCTLCTAEVESGRGGYQTYGRAATRSTTLMDNWRWVRNNREDDNGFEYLRN